MKKKIISLMLVLACVLPLASCKAEDNSPAALSYGSHTMSEAVYSYLASSSKGNYIRTYSDLDNSKDGYGKKLNDDSDMTVGEYLDSLTLNNAKMTLAAAKLFDDYGLSISGEEKKSIKAYVDDLVKEYADGDKKMFNGLLSAYGINTDFLTDIYVEEAKSTAVYNYLYGAEGKGKLSIAQLNEFLDENYVHFQMIYVNNAYENVTDESGNYVFDDDGYVKTEPLPKDKKEKKDAVIAKCEKLLSEGTDFQEVYEKYSEITDYEYGWYLSPAGDYDDPMFVQIAIEAKGLDFGEYKKMDTETGCCIIYRVENETKAWEDPSYEDFFTDFKESANSAAYTEKLTSMFDEIEVKEEIITKYSVADILPCYY